MCDSVQVGGAQRCAKTKGLNMKYKYAVQTQDGRKVSIWRCKKDAKEWAVKHCHVPVKIVTGSFDQRNLCRWKINGEFTY